MAFLQKGLSHRLLKTVGQSVIRGMCQKVVDNPVKFSASKAATWKAEYTRKGNSVEDESAWFQPYVVTGSVAIFLLYFCVLREENDIDDLLSVPLYETVEGLEETHLRYSLQDRLNKGLPTKEISDRLKEIEALKK